MDYSKSPPPSVGTSTQIDYLHAILEMQKAMLKLQTGNRIPEIEVPTLTMQVTSTEPVVIPYTNYETLIKMKFYTGIDATVNISFEPDMENMVPFNEYDPSDPESNEFYNTSSSRSFTGAAFKELSGNSDHDISMNIENEVGLNFTFLATSRVTITNLPINSTIKIYTT